MQSSNNDPGYRIWGADKAVYGPVELPVLVSWIREERVLADTWIFSESASRWDKASVLTELQVLFRGKATPPNSTASAEVEPASSGVPSAGTLRRIKLLSHLTDIQLEKFVRAIEPVQVRQFSEIVKQGQPGDCMYFILEGELRVRLMISGRESVLTTLGPGEFFGEMALFDDAPRSADVIANQDSFLLRFSEASMKGLRDQAPDVAADFLMAIVQSLAARIRADNKRFRDSVNFARSSSGA
ncbi:MAG: cyclic nucleotide-binding domain-containing protein [Verrucomicrobia bacterium]|nr:cyclic nucleotide-binding domain-containing protein [Verrucomicrobiota bacterium]